MNRVLDLATGIVLAIATVTLFALVWFPSTSSPVQSFDDAFLRWMLRIRSEPITLAARILNVLGSVWVTLPIRLAVALYLAVKQRWWHFGGFVGAMIVSEIAIGTLKAAYDRPRPHGTLVAVSGGSFPSGHAVATSVTAVAIVIALFPPSGYRRWLWGAAAALLSLVMALSRAYLAAHWLSDAVAGTLLGTTVALGVALAVEALRPGPIPEPQIAELRPTS
jgi:membrane-associated phospholipid phosphatase